MRIESTDALIVVDLQNDFCHGGALPVNGGNRVVPIANRLAFAFPLVVFTRDWHPLDHCSFAEEPEFIDGSWPVHCTAHSPGAEFHGDLHIPADALIVDKGAEADSVGYSGFEDSNLAEELETRGVKRIFVCGLATDYCVKETALEGVRLGFEVVVVEDACRAVDFPPGTGDQALEDMKAGSVVLCRSKDLIE